MHFLLLRDLLHIHLFYLSALFVYFYHLHVLCFSLFTVCFFSLKEWSMTRDRALYLVPIVSQSLVSLAHSGAQ